MDDQLTYGSAIERSFQQHRGRFLLLSHADWELIEKWWGAGIPLQAVLRGIEVSFDKLGNMARGRGLHQVNSLTWCASAVMAEARRMREAAVGSLAPETVAGMRSGFENNRIMAHLHSAANALEVSPAAPEECAVVANRLRGLAANLNREATQGEVAMQDLEALENSLTSLENELFTALKVATPPAVLEQFSEKATRQSAAFKNRLNAVRLREVQRQFVQKQLLSHFNLPRLSLFYVHQE